MTRPQTPAERMRDACVDECVQWEEVFRGRGELDMAGAAKTCARDVGGIPIPTPTPLELAREAYMDAALFEARLLRSFPRDFPIPREAHGKCHEATMARNDAMDALLRAEKEASDE